jgi:aspartate aminotransferase
MIVINSASGCWKSFLIIMNEVRLAYVLNLNAINGAMDCLEKALEVYPGKVATEKMAAAAAK